MLQCPSVATVVFGIGYIGSRLIQELLFQGREVVALESFFASDRRAVDGFGQARGFRCIEGSIVDAAAVDEVLREADEIESVFLLAAQASAHPSAATAEYTEDVNLRGPRVVLDALTRRHLAGSIVYASSTRVYGSPLPSLVDEQTPLGVFSDLAHLSKCYAEKLLQMYAARYNLPCRVVRLGLVYGVAPIMKTDSRFMTAPNLFCYQAATGAPIEVRSADPLAVIHVSDATQALLLAAETHFPDQFLVFNGASDVTTIPDVAEMIRRFAESREITVTVRNFAKVGRTDSRLPVVRSALDNLGFAPKWHLEEGLAETFDHFLVHRQ